MPNKMLIDASHPEETRVVVVRGNRIEEFDFESQDKKQLKGNIYLARVTRVEPSLQAAFVEYGGNRHGFLAFSEIHPDYYQIPVADRQALLEAEAEAASEDDDDEAEERAERSRPKRRKRGGRSRGGSAADREASADNGSDEDGDSNEDGQEAPALEGAQSSEMPAFETADDEADEQGEDGERKGPAIPARTDADVVTSDLAEDASDDEQADGTDQDAGQIDAPAARSGRSRRRGRARQGAEETTDAQDEADGEVESVGAEDALEELPSRRRAVRKQYKIQEVIKRRQILLVQVVKEERGNKGAALTTYLSLAGRYSVLMPNTARGGGISRKITSAPDRKRLKDVVKNLEVPQGMGVILRTAGANRTKAEIKRDYEYLMRMWENVRTLTLASTAPSLVYEEGSLIKRSVRDLYNKEIDEILVSGEEGYREAKDFMRMLMPSHAKAVQPYREVVPLFVRHGVEAQLDKMLQPQVTLKSGGYIILNQTEALVSIDVNSGRSTKEHSIEDTALQTNLEAAEEIARQLRLRDLAGLIVIDFIDMEVSRNQAKVERCLKDAMRNDRARIQIGRISPFGLLELSRQRLRPALHETSFEPCAHCGGSGIRRSTESTALQMLRVLGEEGQKGRSSQLTLITPTAVALYLFNNKRHAITDMEQRFDLTIRIEADDTLIPPDHRLERIKSDGAVETVTKAPAAATPAAAATTTADGDSDGEKSEEEGGRRRRRRSRRRKRGGEGDAQDTQETRTDSDANESAEAGEETDTDSDGEPREAREGAGEQSEDGAPKRRRRGRRGGRRRRRPEENRSEDGQTEIAADAGGEPQADDPASDTPTADAPASDDVAADGDAPAVNAEAGDAPVAETADAEASETPPEVAEKPKRTRTRRAPKAAEDGNGED
ncbi:MAG: Rne/Rng family ribonuclease, partial [Nitratireductor sp.]